jgi:hypothetical protein
MALGHQKEIDVDTWSAQTKLVHKLTILSPAETLKKQS